MVFVSTCMAYRRFEISCEKQKGVEGNHPFKYVTTQPHVRLIMTLPKCDIVAGRECTKDPKQRVHDRTGHRECVRIAIQDEVSKLREMF